MLESLGFPYDKISPKSRLFDSIIGHKLFEVGLYEMFEQGHNEFCIFADDFDVLRGFNGYSLILVAALVEANYYLFIDTVSNCKFALAAISLTFECAFNELVKFELGNIIPFFN